MRISRQDEVTDAQFARIRPVVRRPRRVSRRGRFRRHRVPVPPRPTGWARSPAGCWCRRATSSMRRWPSDSLRARLACTRSTSAGSTAASNRSASAHACSEVSRVITWIRKPNCTIPAGLAGKAANPVEFLADRRHRLTPGEVDVGVLGRDRPGGSRRSAEEHRRYRVGRVVQRAPSTWMCSPVKVTGSRDVHSWRTTCKNSAVLA